MEFYLVDNKPFAFRNQGTWVVPSKSKLASSEQNFTIEPVARFYCLSWPASVSVPQANVTTVQDKIPTLKLQIIYPYPYLAVSNRKFTFQICSGDGINVLEKLRELCGERNVKINWKLIQCDFKTAADVFEATDLPIKNLSKDGNQCGFGCEMNDVCLPSFSVAMDITNIRGRLTVSMKLAQNAVGLLFLKKFTNSNMLSGSKRLLEDAVYSDLAILSSNGTEIKCHKAMLAAHSNVFEAMFESQMKESITNVVEMSDTSDKAVRAFLGFIYYCDMKDACESCDIALELLVAGDKYNVRDLVWAVAELIVVMSIEWFNVNMSMKLLIFTERQREISDNKLAARLQEKAVRVIKAYTQTSFDVLLNSEVYQQLFHDNLEIAKRISARLFSFAFK